jgi:hypothetical protein
MIAAPRLPQAPERFPDRPNVIIRYAVADLPRGDQMLEAEGSARSGLAEEAHPRTSFLTAINLADRRLVQLPLR